MTAIFMLSPFFTAMGNKNSRHREERSDLHLFIFLKNTDKPPRNTGCVHKTIQQPSLYLLLIVAHPVHFHAGTINGIRDRA